MLVSLTNRHTDSPSRWPAVIEALATSKRETDVVGWFVEGAVLGLILPEIASRDESTVRRIEARLRRELAQHLSGELAATLSMQLHVHPELAGKRDQALAPIDSLLPDLRWRHARMTAYSVPKRVLDVAGSVALLLLLSPLFALIAALVKLSSRGPVFFKQPRIGQMAQPFTMLKFRTMYVNADHALHHDFVTRFITSSDELREPGKEAPFKLANDPRVTPVGRVLRKLSLDELPQIWNVLVGEMSLVGPRPPLSYEVEKYQPWHRRRIFEVKPGVTGLWQVAGRSRTTFDEMVRLDLRYARTCSLWTDIKILLQTPGAVISGKGAA